MSLTIKALPHALRACVALLAPVALAAQQSAADSLLARGRVATAESLYYAAAREHPRDPAARIALGRYVAARGKPRVGAVLLEEARQFGGSSAAIARDLAPLYRILGDYRALATLGAAQLEPAVRAQAAWLVSHPPGLSMPESISVVYSASPDSASLGRLVLHVGSKILEAEIDPRRTGITLDRRRMHDGGMRSFSPDTAAVGYGVAQQVELGPTLTNVAVTFESLGGPNRARLGLDVLARWAPMFDPVARRMELHSSGDLPSSQKGDRVPTLVGTDGTRLLWNGRFVPLASGEVGQLLRTKRWGLDATQGELVIGF